ncbi:hypothetical protein ACT4ML_07240 [Natrinema sp. LN54]|uniref:hypothetical protein n=1 Tax=Natrinema sp. LN54 TaxID=3458705 RepID=UPI0040375621
MTEDISIDEGNNGEYVISSTDSEFEFTEEDLKELFVDPENIDPGLVAESIAVELNTDALSDFDRSGYLEDGSLKGGRRLREKVSKKNSIMLDSTTFKNAISLMKDGNVISDLRILDLKVFAYATILFDDIYVTAGPDMDKVNSIFEEDIFHALEPRNKQEDLFLHALWYDTVTKLESLPEEDEIKLRKSISNYLGKDISEVEFDWRSVDLAVNSPPNFYKNLSYSGSLGAVDDYFITMSTFRSFFNHELARQLGLVYLPNSARGPIEDYIISNTRRSKPTFDAIINEFEMKLDDQLENQRDKNPYLAEPITFRCPMFLSVLIQRANEPKDLMDVLPEVRDEAGPYREHSKELRTEVKKGNLEKIEEIQSVLNDEASGLTSKLGGTTVKAAVESVPAIPGIGGEAKYFLKALQLFSGFIGETFDKFGERLYQRIRNPHYHFLTNITSEARKLTSLEYAIEELWETQTDFNFERMARIQTNYPYFE